MRPSDLDLRARAPGLTGLALLALLWTGCPPPTNGNPDGGNISGDPPQLSLGVPDTNAADTALKMNVTVTGCNSVQTLAIFNNDQFIKKIPYTGTPTQFSLAPNEVPYNHSVAASLTLTAKAWCQDGRSNTSPPQSVQYFPVAQVVTLPGGGPVVPDTFYAEGSGAGTAFIGCSEDAAGRRSLVKVDVTGNVVASNSSLPFPCAANSVFTDKNPLTGTRWMWTPGVGALAYDSSLNITSFITTPVTALGVGPDGDAVVYEDVQGGSFVRRYPAKSGSNTTAASALWYQTPPGGGTQISLILGSPVVTPDGSVYLAYFVTTPVGATSGTVTVQRLDYVHGGRVAGQYDIKVVPYGFGDAPPRPPVTFSADGSIIYVPNQLAVGQTEVLACSTAGNDCTGPTFKWRSGTLSGDVLLLLPYASGSRVAAVTPQHVYFLRANDGVTVSSVDPDGALVANGVQPGLGRDFFALFGDNKAGAPALEIVGLDSAENGELFRYQLLGGSLTAAVADDGQLWMRIGNNLVKPMPLPEYRLVK